MDKPEHSENSGGKKKPSGAAWRMAGTVSVLGIEFAICTLAGFYLGSWLGSRLGNQGIWVAASVLAGMAAGIIGAVAVIRRIMRESDE
ncbi:AtpZ/AtpI family protein [Paenibacillus caui]|uniref:AtpZ/AtpI family protein n=1 Tax=Paenibacillus caui TaxID=2873927 RepID=UPI001CA8E97A|nr:AtpZ/AtpI family protein [Paenibacillus caui]